MAFCSVYADSTVIFYGNHGFSNNELLFQAGMHTYLALESLLRRPNTREGMSDHVLWPHDVTWSCQINQSDCMYILKMNKVAAVLLLQGLRQSSHLHETKLAPPALHPPKIMQQGIDFYIPV